VMAVTKLLGAFFDSRAISPPTSRDRSRVRGMLRAQVFHDSEGRPLSAKKGRPQQDVFSSSLLRPQNSVATPGDSGRLRLAKQPVRI